MFGGFAEGMAYGTIWDSDEFGVPVLSHSYDDDDDNGVICTDILPSASLFGGFKTWPQENTDFVLIAECSEICGPNPICTIPCTVSTDINLGLLSILILSADFQEFSRSVPTKDTQVLMPDIMDNLHAAVNHFVIYDHEARGFVRSLCIAYVTSDKHKLIEMDEDIFKHLADASLLIQHSNKNFSEKGLKLLFRDLECTKSELASRLKICPTDVSEDLKLYDELIESSLQDIQDIFNCIKSSMVMESADQLISEFIDKFVKKFNPDGCLDFILKTNDEACDSMPKILKLPIQQNFGKPQRNLFIVSPGGFLMALYHLYVMHKHFKRKYEDIFIDSCDESEDTSLSNTLHFGACLKFNSGVKSQEQGCCDVDFCEWSPNLSLLHTSSAFDIDIEFCDNILHILKIEFYDRRDLESIAAVQQKPKENSTSDATTLGCNRHVVPLNKLWTTLEHFSSKTPGIESSVVKFLQKFPWTEGLLFSLFTHVPILILYDIEEEFLVANFIRVLATVTPRNLSQELFVEHDRKVPLRKEDLKNRAIVTFCLLHEKSKLMPSEVMPSVSILCLRSSSYHGPKYTGCLLNSLNGKVKCMTSESAIFALLISIISKIERHTKFWEKVSSSVNSSQCQSIMNEKGFSKCDVKIMKCLSKMNSRCE